MFDPPQIVSTPRRLAAVIHVTIPREQIREVMGPGIEELTATVGRQGIEIVGPWYTHHLRMQPDVFDFEIGVPVAAAVRPEGRVVAGELAARDRVAKTIYTGAYEGLPGAWGEFMEWIERQGLRPAEDLWECYVKGPESGPDAATYQTELYRPLKT